MFDNDLKPYPDGPGFARDSETSRMAAEQVDDEGQLVDVLSCFHSVSHTGATCDEITVMMNEKFPRWRGMECGTVAARMVTLKTKGIIFSKGERRKTRKGRSAEVFIHKNYMEAQGRLF